MSSSDLSATSLCRALGDGWCRLVRGAVHGEVLLLPGGSLGIGGEAFPDMNWAYVHGPDGVEEAVHAFVQRLRARKLPGVISVAPLVAGQVEAAARELGLKREEDWPLMSCRATEFRPPGSPSAHTCVAERVVNQAAIDEVADVLGDAYELPAWQCASMIGTYSLELADADYFLARVDGEAASAAGTARVGTTVGFYAVGTRQALRRRGAASAALACAVDYHVARGAELLGLLGSADGTPMYERLGFTTVEMQAAWLVDGV
jgi:GNAT superfamily N-acetyltransferase